MRLVTLWPLKLYLLATSFYQRVVSKQEMIPKMIEAGTDIFRLNCSHRRGGDFERVYPLIRKTAKEMGKKASGFLVRKGCHLFTILVIYLFPVYSKLHCQHCCRSYTGYMYLGSR